MFKISTVLRAVQAVNAVALAATLATPVLAESGPGPGPLGPGPGCNFFPASAAVGTSIDPSYFGPPPSASNPSLVGPVQLLKSGTIDFTKGTITLPLYQGKTVTGKTVWYILTDTNDQANATGLGLNFSAKLTYAATGARRAQLNANGELVFAAGTVDFAPERSVVPGPSDHPYPPSSTQPGSVGDAAYSPLVKIVNTGGYIYNAPIIAFGVEAAQINFPDGNPDYRLVHDEVVAIDIEHHTVTLNLINGYSFGRPVWYLSMDASDPAVAAIEGNTYAPLLGRLPTGTDDSFSSPVERIFIATNGAQDGGCANPSRQGLSAALTDGFRPNNVFGGIPTLATDYSPAWDAQFYEWTAPSIASGFRGPLNEEFRILTLVRDGYLSGPNGAPFGSTGVIINCPPVFRLN